MGKAKRGPISEQGAKKGRKAIPTASGVKLLFVPTEPDEQAPATDPVSIRGANTQREDKGTNEDTGKQTDKQTQKASTQAETKQDSKTDTTQTTAQNTKQTGEIGKGDVSASIAETAASYAVATLARVESQADATRRWRNEGIDFQVAAFRDRVREDYRKAHPGCRRRDAHDHAWARAMSAFPPPGVDPEAIEEEADPEVVDEFTPEPEGVFPDAPVSTIVDTPQADEGVPGLGELPESWGDLPANATLQVEISWVSANRLRVRDGSGVDLSKALSPAPSYSALSWLETSILFPSKFADISVKATQNQEDEKEHVRRERLAIDEIRALLAEMVE